MFAIDSVPAAFSVTSDRFIVYTSNVFAILGLRSLFIALSAALAHLRYLHYGLAAVLSFAALKMLTSNWVHVPPLVSVAIILSCIGAAIWASIRAEEREPETTIEGTDASSVGERQPAPHDAFES
jgi:tellurite resistance protein TerC